MVFECSILITTEANTIERIGMRLARRDHQTAAVMNGKCNNREDGGNDDE
jgi:hypothetical protein